MSKRSESDWDELELPRGGKPSPTAASAATDEPRSRAGSRNQAGGSSASGPKTPAPNTNGWGVGPGGDIQRLRALTGAPQAVVKIIGYRRGDGGGAAASLRYIGREDRNREADPNAFGAIVLETHTGETLHSREDRDRLLQQWADGFSARKSGRDVMHLMLSFPAGVSPELAGAIAREALPRMFPGRDFAFGVHADTAHAHVHALVRMRGPDGRQLRTDRAMLRGWREIVAELARSRDVALEASPRWARGLSEKRERAWERAMRLRGEIPRTHRAAAREVQELLARGEKIETRFEQLMRATAARERAALQGLSWALIAEARTAPGETRGRLLDLAELALARAAALPDPRSRREIMAAIAEARGKDAGGATGPGETEAIARAFAEGREVRAVARDHERLSRDPLNRARDEMARVRDAAAPPAAPAPAREADVQGAPPTSPLNHDRDPAKDQDRDRDRE